jgi:cytochrome c oxidase cbb3-type subunit 3
MKKIWFFVAALLGSITTHAQSVAASKTFYEDPIHHPSTMLVIISGLVILSLVLVVVATYYIIKTLNILTDHAAREHAKKTGVAYVPQPSVIEKITQQINASVPIEKEQDIDMGHDFDGIRELDNHLPPWWKWLFYATIVFAVVYLVLYHGTGTLPLQTEEYQRELAKAEVEANLLKASQPGAQIDENTIVYEADPALTSNGKAIYNNMNCGSCHGQQGEGNTIGPNLTDAYWIHGGGIKNIFLTIKNGAIDKGMPAWGKAMKPQDVRDVTFYVMSLQGTNPSNAKAPQGELYEEEVVPAKEEEVKEP